MNDKRNLPSILLQSSCRMSFRICLAVNYLQGRFFQYAGIVSAAGNLSGLFAGPFPEAKMDEEERCKALSLYPFLSGNRCVSFRDACGKER